MNVHIYQLSLPEKKHIRVFHYVVNYSITVVIV